MSDAVRAVWEELFSAGPGHEFTTESSFAAADRVIVQWRYDWPGGHVRGTDLFRVQNGLVAEKLSCVKG